MRRSSASIARSFAITLLSLILLGLGLWIPTPTEASGTFRPFPPRPPAATDLDRERYELGRAILTRRVRLRRQRLSSTQLQQQTRQLETMQRQLPRSLQRRLDLPRLAPFLTPSQLDALGYYLSRRYNIRVNSF